MVAEWSNAQDSKSCLFGGVCSNQAHVEILLLLLHICVCGCGWIISFLVFPGCSILKRHGKCGWLADVATATQRCGSILVIRHPVLIVNRPMSGISNTRPSFCVFFFFALPVGTDWVMILPPPPPRWMGRGRHVLVAATGHGGRTDRLPILTVGSVL